MTSEKTETFSLGIVFRLVFIIAVESVYWAVRTESSHKTDMSRPKRVKSENESG